MVRVACLSQRFQMRYRFGRPWRHIACHRVKDAAHSHCATVDDRTAGTLCDLLRRMVEGKLAAMTPSGSRTPSRVTRLNACCTVTRP